MKRIETLVRENPRFGYRRITAMLRFEGCAINPKRVYRVWRKKGYWVEASKKKRHVSAASANACNKRRAELPNDIWAYDFIFGRLGNGRALKILAMKGWLKATGIEGLNVEKASPWQNGYAESFNSRFRDECLNMNQFYTLKEAKMLISDWQEKYNGVRPHSGLSWLTPVEFAKRIKEGSAGLGPSSDELLPGQFSFVPSQTLLSL